MADIRTAAQREAEHRWPSGEQWSAKEVESARGRFVMGAVWAAASVTPTREQIATVLAEGYQSNYSEKLPVNHHDLRAADAVLALMQELAEGEG